MMKVRLAGSLVMILLITLLAGCAGSQQAAVAEGGRSDPFEPFNRAMFSFNYSVMDRFIVRPVAVVWRDYMPQPARNGLSNFTSNLEEPAITANYLLQGKIYSGMKHFTRFFLNSTLGLGGLIDVAAMANPKLERERSRRFGSTLAFYHAGYGPYLQLPFYGSFTLRDDGGNLVDHLYPALSWLSWPASVGKWLVEGVEKRAQLLDSDGLLRQSADPYIFTREAYFQSHDFIANDGKLLPEKNPNSQAIEKDLPEIDAP